MIQVGNTIVRKHENGSLDFYWLCDIRNDGYLFFDWYGNPYRASLSDYWKVCKDTFENEVKVGKIEIYDCLPLEKYGDIFEEQARQRAQR